MATVIAMLLLGVFGFGALRFAFAFLTGGTGGAARHVTRRAGYRALRGRRRK